MPIRPFGLSGGGGLDRNVGCWNGSRNLRDGCGKNGGAGGGPDGVVDVEAQMMEVAVEMVEAIN